MNRFFKSLTTSQCLGIIILIGAFFRFYRIDFQSIWIDELHTMIESNPDISFKESYDLIIFREGIPPFYFFIIKILFGGFGYTILIARTISVFVGLLSIYGVYLLCREYVEKKWSLVAATFMAVHPFLIEYSQEARTYTFYMCFTVFLFLYVSRFIKSFSYKDIIIVGILSGLTVNSHIIGFLNVATAFLFLGIFWLFQQNNRMHIFKKIVVGFFIFILFSIPVLNTLKSVTSYTSFWILKPSLEYSVKVFKDLFGGSAPFLIIFLIFYLIYLVNTFKIQKTQYRLNIKFNSEFQLFILLNLWIWFEVAVIYLKSIFGVSIVLHRYFIAIIPACVMILTLSIRSIQYKRLHKYLTYSLLTVIIVHFLFIRKYYTTITKAQYDKITSYVIENNNENDIIVSNWGWLMSYYFNTSNNLISIEKNLDDYLNEMRMNKIPIGSFWYVDGNSRQFEVSEENQKYLNDNFTVTFKKEYYDCWAINFKSKNNNQLSINMHKFNPSSFDGSGAMIFVNNLKSSYPEIKLNKGLYKITIKGRSLPEVPINGENAHFNIYVNSTKIKSFYLSEKKDNSALEFEFEHQGGNLNLQIEYDNDYGQNGLDRNAIIDLIQLSKK